MTTNNNAYIKVKLGQIKEQREQLKKQLKDLDEKEKGYKEQLVPESKTSTSTD